MEIILDIGLAAMLVTTLFHAIRLERALGVLRRDRTSLEALVASFNAATQAAETGVERLRAATDGAGRQIQKQIDAAGVLKDDLTFLVQRGEGLADRLDDLLRSARPAAAPIMEPVPARSPYVQMPRPKELVREYARDAAEEPRSRSQAERDLLKALRMAR